MKAIRFANYGTLDVLQLTEVVQPTLQENELLIKVEATAVNQGDRYIVSGIGRFSGDGLFRPQNGRLGADVAGRVVAVGNRVSRFQPGDALFGDLSAHGRGAFAEFVAVSEDAPLARIPEGIPFEQAAAVPLTAVTALQGLRDNGRLQAEQQVLINGAAGGVGSFAVQIAKALGAEVTAVASRRKLALAQRLGADHLIDYAETDFTQNGRQYDLIFDTVGNRSLAEIRPALTSQGSFVTTTFMPAVALQGRWVTLTSQQRFHNMMAKPNRDDLAFLAELMEQGQLTAVIDRCYPLSKTAEALRYLAEGHAQGKVIIKPI